MKFVHIADMHFDSPFVNLSDKESLGDLRRLDQRKAFKKVIEYIKENKIKWYIYKKINVNYILCGNKINRSESDKIKLIKSDPNLIFYRVPSEKQNE